MSAQHLIQIDGRYFMLASIQIPVELFTDGTYKIYTENYKIEFQDEIKDPDMLEAIRNAPPSEENAPSMIESITRILSDEIKPRRKHAPSNTSFKVYPSHRKTPKHLRYSRKARDPIQILPDAVEPESSSDREDADSSGEETVVA